MKLLCNPEGHGTGDWEGQRQRCHMMCKRWQGKGSSRPWTGTGDDKQLQPSPTSLG